jgi:hypothetical protein
MKSLIVQLTRLSRGSVTRGAVDAFLKLHESLVLSEDHR